MLVVVKGVGKKGKMEGCGGEKKKKKEKKRKKESEEKKKCLFHVRTN